MKCGDEGSDEGDDEGSDEGDDECGDESNDEGRELLLRCLRGFSDGRTDRQLTNYWTWVVEELLL